MGTRSRIHRKGKFQSREGQNWELIGVRRQKTLKEKSLWMRHKTKMTRHPKRKATRKRQLQTQKKLIQRPRRRQKRKVQLQSLRKQGRRMSHRRRRGNRKRNL